jgi:hypothetical protein
MKLRKYYLTEAFPSGKHDLTKATIFSENEENKILEYQLQHLYLRG